MTRWLLVPAFAGALACTSPGNARQANDTAATSVPAAVAQPTSTTPAEGDSTRRELQRRADRSRIAGDTAATVWMVEVSDFQCPFCARFHSESYPQIRRDYIATGKVKLAYVNFPLPSHEHAFPAAEAALCAGAQGRFWQMHDALFQTQEVWSARPSALAYFDTLAARVGLKGPPFQQCMRDHVMRDLVQQDFDRGRASGVGSTPTFFVGDTAILGAQPLAVFRRVLDSAIAKSARGTGSR